MLINCAAYRNGQRLKDLKVEEISDYLLKKDGFVWVALKDPTDEELKLMQAEFNLHPLAVEDAMKGHQRPKIEEYGDCLFVVLHTLEINLIEEVTLGEADIFVGHNYVLSVRKRSEQGFASVRDRCEQQPELLKNGPAFILYSIMDTVVDRYFPVIDALEQQLELLEERIFSKGASARLNIEEVYTLKRKLMLVQHAAIPLLESVGKLFGGRVPAVCEPLQEYFRDVSDHLSRVSKSLESIREMSTTAIQVNLSLISLADSEITKKLAAYGALFAVPTAIAGVYGMNFKYMPELESVWGYPAVLLLMIGLDLFFFLRFRKARWI